MEAWFNEQTAGMIGGIFGTFFGVFGGGILGGMSYWFIQKGLKKLYFSLYSFQLILGLAMLLAGIAAIILKQPYHVWYPLVLSGVLVFGIMGPLYFTIKKRFTDAELNKLQAKDL